MTNTIESSHRPSKLERIFDRLEWSPWMKEFVERLPEDFEIKGLSFSFSYHPPKIQDEIKHEKNVGITRDIVGREITPSNNKRIHLNKNDRGEVFEDA